MAGLDDIDTIVIVMMENRSFDHVLGYLSHPSYGNRQDIDGLRDPQTTTDYDNFYQNEVYKPFATDDDKLSHDLPHKREEIATQIDLVNGQATMAGFVQAYVDDTHSVVRPSPPMAFQVPSTIPVTNFLATEYLTCNRWFAPVPSGTQPNRAVAYTGNTLIDDNVTATIPHDKMVLDWLTQHNVRWRVYHSGLSFFLLFDPLKDYFSTNFRSIRDFPKDFQSERARQAPQVIFIEPEYEDSPVHLGFPPNDNHPPLSMGPGEAFLHMVYSALTNNPKRWARTLLVVTYDEHGGFFDHHEPPAIRMDPPSGAQYSDAFTTTGVRVPSIVASPLVPRGGVSDALFDHTSVLQLLAEKFAGDKHEFSDDVNNRIGQGIECLSTALTLPSARDDAPLPPAAPIASHMHYRGGVKKLLTENQVAFRTAADQHLKAGKQRALKAFPELAMLKPNQ